jgi:site-specific DNA recombinase
MRGDYNMRAALYARVSTDLQEKEQTIESQLETLRHYAADRSYEVVAEYIDEGYSGATLARPGLDRLRDTLPDGGFDLVLIHSPDRLARKAAYQGILIEEFEKHKVSLEFLNHPTDNSPEGRMLLGMQGLFAEYERSKIAERTRRGRLHKAKQGILVGGPQPYGYRYIKRDGDKPPTLAIDEEQATTVRMMYHWLVEEQASIRHIARRLMELSIPAPGGGSAWRSSTVGRILSYELYAGKGYYNKRRRAEPEHYQKTVAYRKDPKSSFRARPKEEWLPFPAPAIISRDTWEKAQLQLEQNARHSPRNNKRFQYLLKGLLRCAYCGRPLVGQSQKGRCYYRHNRGETPWLEQPCPRNKSYHRDNLESLIWDTIAGALQNPTLLAQEYRRRLLQSQASHELDSQGRQLAIALNRLKVQEDRLLDAYKNEVIELPRLKEEMDGLKARRQGLERERRELERLSQEQVQGKDALVRLEVFCHRVSQGLEHLTFEDKQKLLRLIVNRIIVDDYKVSIEGLIPLDNHHPEAALCPPRSYD